MPVTDDYDPACPSLLTLMVERVNLKEVIVYRNRCSSDFDNAELLAPSAKSYSDEEIDIFVGKCNEDDDIIAVIPDIIGSG